eukprot:m.66422 g.66422  ORF g.66422 m.66422 type:complete len:1299 (+) comp35387_c1_seq2:23-3919(+)
MRNLGVLCCSSGPPNEAAADFVCMSVESKGKSFTIYSVSRGDLVAINSSNFEETIFTASLTDAGFLSEGTKTVAIEFVLEHDGVCLALSSGDVLLYNTTSGEFECMGSVDSGLLAMSWSPDQELVAFITGSLSLILMTKNFDPLIETPVHSDNFGEAQFVTVGWGKKETQFHGSEGKPKVNVIPEAITPVFPWDDCIPRVSWRGDGQYFSCSAVSPDTGARKLRVWNRDGILQSTSEDVSGLEQALHWRPSGNLIACTQRKPHRHDVIFFERNGLKHGEFTLPFGQKEVKVRELQWNNTSSVLAILIEHLSTKNVQSVVNSYIQLWHSNNYHWYLKQEIRFSSSTVASFLWDPEVAYRLHAITSDGRLLHYKFYWTTNQSTGMTGNPCTIAVIDGDQLLFTHFKYQVVPPPMAAQTMKFPAPVNQLAFGPPPNTSNALVLLSDNRIALVSRNKLDGASPAELVDITDINCEGGNFLNEPCCLRNLLWWKPSVAWAIGFQPDSQADCLFEMTLLVDEKKLRVCLRKCFSFDLPVLQLYFNADTGMLMVEYVDGSLATYVEGGDNSVPFFDSWTDRSGKPYVFPHPCFHIATTVFKSAEVPVGLSDWHRFYVDSKEIARDCTSFAIHNDFLLFTTHQHTCEFLPLACSLEEIESTTARESQRTSESVRRVERGSRIVCVDPQGTRLVLQMPRGNLETIHPRPLVLSAVRKSLDCLEFGEAFVAMRKHRIDMNLIYDHNPEVFSRNVDIFVSQLRSAADVSLFLSDLRPENVTLTMYSGWGKSQPKNPPKNDDKISEVCDLLISAMEKVDSSKYVLSIITAHVKKPKAELEEALLRIRSLRERSDSPVTAEEALKYLVVLVDVDRLYDVALGTYNLPLVMMVAENSQKDPKEYLPFLNQFRAMTEYDKYRIDKHLKRHQKALGHMSKCDPKHFPESLELIQHHGLYAEALRIYKGREEESKAIALKYGTHLKSQRKYDEAGLVLMRHGHLRDALSAFQKAGKWRHCFCLAVKLQYPQTDLVELARNLSEHLKNHRRFAEAAEVLDQYVQDHEEACLVLVEGALWDEAMRLVYKYGRIDLLETILQPALVDACDSHVSSIASCQQEFLRHAERLKIVRIEKAKQIAEFGFEDAVGKEPDLFSETSSVTGHSTAGSGFTKTSGRSRKSQRKAESRKYRLKEGSPFEDIALLKALKDIVHAVDKKQRDVGSLLRMLYLFGYDDQAAQLQESLNAFLLQLKNRTEEIWPREGSHGDGNVIGPHSTVNSILSVANQGVTIKDTSEDFRMPVVEDIKWKLELINSDS